MTTSGVALALARQQPSGARESLTGERHFHAQTLGAAKARIGRRNVRKAGARPATRRQCASADSAVSAGTVATVVAWIGRRLLRAVSSARTE